MTCIVAIKDKDKIYIGGDTLASGGGSCTNRKDIKVFKNGNMLFGFTSSYRMGQILQYTLKIPLQPQSMSDMEYMTTIFIDSITEVYKSKGYLGNDKGVFSGGVFIVGYRGEIYTVYSDFQIAVSKDDYVSCGCGEEFALGSLYTSQAYNTYAPPHRIKMAIKAAAAYSTGVGGDIIIRSIKV